VTWWCWSAERRRQDQLHRGDLVLSPGRGLRRATLDDVADNQGDGSWAVSAEVERRARTGNARHRHRRARQRGGREPALPDRPRAGDFSYRIRRSFAHGLADAFDDGLFMGAASERRRFFDRLVLAIDSEHSSRVSALDRSLRFAQPPAGGAQLRRPLVRRDRSAKRRTRRRGSRDARPDCHETRGDVAHSATLGVSIRTDHARRLDENALTSEPATAVEDRLPREFARRPRPRRGRAVPSTSASHRSAGDLAPKTCRRGCVHRRAKGASDRAGAGARRSRREMTAITPLLCSTSGCASRSRQARGAVP